MSRRVAQVSRRNQTLGVLNGMLVNLGNTFVDPFTVLPVFITTLGGSSVLVGFVSSSFTAGWFLPQLFVAGIVQARTRVLPIYAASAAFRLIGFVGAGVAVFLMPIGHPNAILAFVIGGLTLTALAAGVAGVPFLEITSKTVPVNQRGAFFAGRRVMGGVLGVLAGLMIAAVLKGDPGAMFGQTWVYRSVESAVNWMGLSGHPFPHDYGILIIIGGVISCIGVIAYLFVHEPPATHVRKPVPIKRQVADGFAMLKAMPGYRGFLWMRVFYQLTAMSFPFYATYAYVKLGFSQASVGVFVSIWVGASVLSNLVWGRLLDRKGNRIVFVATAAMSVVPPIAVLTLAGTGVHPGGVVGLTVFGIVASTFLLNGFVRSGRFIANHTYLLESAPADRRPLYIGFMNTLTFPFMLSPILGGIVVALFGYPTLFVVAECAAVANLIASLRLIEPRVAVPATDGEVGAV